jgi:hypothetical protein
MNRRYIISEVDLLSILKIYGICTKYISQEAPYEFDKGIKFRNFFPDKYDGLEVKWKTHTKTYTHEKSYLIDELFIYYSDMFGSKTSSLVIQKKWIPKVINIKIITNGEIVEEIDVSDDDFDFILYLNRYLNISTLKSKNREIKLDEILK